MSRLIYRGLMYFIVNRLKPLDPMYEAISRSSWVVPGDRGASACTRRLFRGGSTGSKVQLPRNDRGYVDGMAPISE